MINQKKTKKVLLEYKRSLKRKNKDFIEKQVLRNHRYTEIKTTDGTFKLVSIGNPDSERLISCLEHIAYGLFYQEFKERFEGKINMVLEFLEYSDENMQTFKKMLKKRFELEMKLNRGIKGENPKVFYYQFLEPDNFGLIAMRMVFYETAETYVAFKGENAKEPFDIVMKFFQNEFHTIFEVGDEKFEFNK